tara:strand:- start:59355 stop:60335 length:981 start_codon:yes stop_codon:yes gene_type:complete
MFNHPKIQKFGISEIPLNQDIYLMDDRWISEYEIALTKAASGENVDISSIGYISYAAARSADDNGVDLSWYPNIYDRFHEVRVRLPHSEFITCVGYWQGDIKPRIFVQKKWHDQLYLRNHSVFALVDAIGVKDSLASGILSREKLTKLREGIDKVASENPTVAFVSFADTLLLKSNWTVGPHNTPTKNTYRPETIIHLIPEIQKIYQDILGLSVYASLTQGANEYYDDDLIHISKEKNHFSLNSLGLPFAQISAIEIAARQAIKCGIHKPKELYLDENFFRSLKWDYKFNKKALALYTYSSPMSQSENRYIAMGLDDAINNLQMQV